MQEFTRPQASVLPDGALVPEKRLVEPPPNRFTHQADGQVEYWYDQLEEMTPPAGTLPAGARVVLMRHDGGRYCRVVDERGLYVTVAFERLRKL